MTIEALWYTRCAVPTPLGIAGRRGRLHEAFKAEGIAVQDGD